MKKLLIMVFALFLMCGCQQNHQEEFEVDFDVNTVMDEILANFAVGMISDMDEEYINEAYGFDLDKINEYVWKEAPILSTETYVIFELKSTEYVDEFVEKLEVVKGNLINSFDSYIPEQGLMAKESRIESKEQYVFFICSENIDRIYDLLYAQFN